MPKLTEKQEINMPDVTNPIAKEISKMLTTGGYKISIEERELLDKVGKMTLSNSVPEFEQFVGDTQFEREHKLLSFLNAAVMRRLAVAQALPCEFNDTKTDDYYNIQRRNFEEEKLKAMHGENEIRKGLNVAELPVSELMAKHLKIFDSLRTVRNAIIACKESATPEQLNKNLKDLEQIIKDHKYNGLHDKIFLEIIKLQDLGTFRGKYHNVNQSTEISITQTIGKASLGMLNEAIEEIKKEIVYRADTVKNVQDKLENINKEIGLLKSKFFVFRRASKIKKLEDEQIDPRNLLKMTQSEIRDRERNLNSYMELQQKIAVTLESQSNTTQEKSKVEKTNSPLINVKTQESVPTMKQELPKNEAVLQKEGDHNKEQEFKKPDQFQKSKETAKQIKAVWSEIASLRSRYGNNKLPIDIKGKLDRAISRIDTLGEKTFENDKEILKAAIEGGRNSFCEKVSEAEWGNISKEQKTKNIYKHSIIEFAKSKGWRSASDPVLEQNKEQMINQEQHNAQSSGVNGKK